MDVPTRIAALLVIANGSHSHPGVPHFDCEARRSM